MTRRNNWLKKSAVAVFLTMSLGAIAEPISITQPQTSYKEQVSQRQVVDLLIADALRAFKSPARISHAGLTGKLQSNMEIVAGKLLTAYEMEPYRADLLFSAASAYIANKDVDKAIELYNKVLTIAPDDIDAHSYLSAWLRFKGDNQASESHMSAITKYAPARAEKLRSVFAIIDRVSATPIYATLPESERALAGKKTAIVTLGYALNSDGTLHQTLIERLETTLNIAKQLPDAMIAVTGGVPQNNQTEADLMSKWLVEKGIDVKRVYQDNFARTTVENALFTRYALAKEKVENIVFISSGSHVRRGQSMFEIATQDTGPHNIHYVMVGSLDKPLDELQKITEGDLLGIYRDALKAMGLWSYRSYPLEER